MVNITSSWGHISYHLPQPFLSSVQVNAYHQDSFCSRYVTQQSYSPMPSPGEHCSAAASKHNAVTLARLHAHGSWALRPLANHVNLHALPSQPLACLQPPSFSNTLLMTTVPKNTGAVCTFSFSIPSDLSSKLRFLADPSLRVPNSSVFPQRAEKVCVHPAQCPYRLLPRAPALQWLCFSCHHFPSDCPTGFSTLLPH